MEAGFKKIICATCKKEFDSVFEAFGCCVREESDYITCDVGITLEQPIQRVNVVVGNETLQ